MENELEWKVTSTLLFVKSFQADCSTQCLFAEPRTGYHLLYIDSGVQEIRVDHSADD